MVVLKEDLISSVEVEVLPDNEYALWEQAVTDAEQQYSERRKCGQLESLPNQQPAAQESAAALPDLAVTSGLESVLLPDLEDFGLKINRRAKHRPRGLRVTDITGAEWCQQQLAFALSARLPKVIFCSTLAIPVLWEKYVETCTCYNRKSQRQSQWQLVQLYMQLWRLRSQRFLLAVAVSPL